MNNWTIAEIWNSSLEKSDRQIEPRERLYASELGGSLIDRWYKLRGEQYTNPPNSRSMRKFMAGDIWEWIIKQVLIKCGIQFTQQDRVWLEYPNMLPISGKIDFIAGGKIDYDEVLKNLEEEDIPDFIKNPAKSIVETFKEKYPDGLEQKIIEIKSVGSFVFESLLEQDNPRTHHMLQGAVYHLVKKIPTDIVYVCRDDCRLLQYNIDEIVQGLEIDLKKDLEQITYYHKNNIEPPKEPLILFEGKFKTNWKVQYSPYLSKLYSYEVDGKTKQIESPDEYFEFFSPLISSWNRVIARINKGEKLTKNNEEKIEQMNQYGFEDIINNLIKKNANKQSDNQES